MVKRVIGKIGVSEASFFEGFLRKNLQSLKENPKIHHLKSFKETVCEMKLHKGRPF